MRMLKYFETQLSGKNIFDTYFAIWSFSSKWLSSAKHLLSLTKLSWKLNAAVVREVVG